MPKGNLSRRGFVQNSLGALTFGAGLPAWYAREVVAAEEVALARAARRVAPNDKLVGGSIGVGGMGTGDMNALRGKGVQITAVCDVDRARREKAAKDVGGDCKAYKDFRELLDDKNIDVVTISTPDHWHTLIALAAIKAGKQIYCQKPLTLTVAEGIALVKAARKHDTVFQVGSQQRSDARFRLACELVRNGRIGKIKRVEARIGDNPQGGPFKTEDVPEGLDWDFWLGQTPYVDYVKQRCHYEFRWWYEYSGGKMTDWGAHHNDIAQWGLGADGSGPASVEATFEPTKAREPNCYNCPPHFEVTYTYPKNFNKFVDGTKLVTMSKGENGVKFEGDDGWIFVDRGQIQASDEKLLKEPLSDDATRLYKSDDHYGNFVECVRDKKRPICDVEVGHRSVTTCHIGNIAMRLDGRLLKWDAEKEHFLGDALADEMLSREMRAPWKLEA